MKGAAIAVATTPGDFHDAVQSPSSDAGSPSFDVRPGQLPGHRCSTGRDGPVGQREPARQRRFGPGRQRSHRNADGHQKAPQAKGKGSMGLHATILREIFLESEQWVFSPARNC